MASSSSVVMPGRTAWPTRSIARAAIRPDSRISSISAGVYTSPRSDGVGPGLPTYSGRGMRDGTGRIAVTRPGIR